MHTPTQVSSANSQPKIKLGKKFWQLSPITWFALDFLLGGTAMCLAYKLTPADVVIAAPRHLSSIAAAVLYSLVLTLSSHAVGLHNNLNLRTRARIVTLSFVSVFLAVTMLSLVVSVVLYGQIGRYIVFINAGLSVLLGSLVRLFVHERIHASPLLVRVEGDIYLKQYLQELAEENPGRLLVQGEVNSGQSSDVIVIADSILSSPAETAPFLLMAGLGTPIFSAAAFVESYFYRIPAQYVSTGWLFSLNLHRLHPFHHEVKRFLDIALASLGLVLSAPLILIAVLLIRLESPGPVFYSQIRVGLYQRPFRIWKLRSMYADAEKSGAQWAKVGDSRVTWIGKILRTTRIDELPQFWNILIGDMAFVGPRPERPEFVEQLAIKIPYYRQRHLVKPGLTGWAQICYPYGASTKDAWNKLSYDFYYMKNFSLLLDLQILLQTVGAASRGAR